MHQTASSRGRRPLRLLLFLLVLVLRLFVFVLRLLLALAAYALGALVQGVGQIGELAVGDRAQRCAPCEQGLATELFVEVGELGKLAQPLDYLRQQLLWFQPEPTAGEVGRRTERDPSLLRPAQDIPAENRGGKSDLGYISHQISLSKGCREQTLRLARDAHARDPHLAGGGSEWSSSPWPRSSLRFSQSGR
ncbi:hypothetical protein [Streptomyces sp. NPDC002172]